MLDDHVIQRASIVRMYRNVFDVPPSFIQDGILGLTGFRIDTDIYIAAVIASSCIVHTLASAADLDEGCDDPR